MAHRIVAQNAVKCPFCGCAKMFVKAHAGGTWNEKRFSVSLQCSKCHVNGPEIGTWNEKRFSVSLQCSKCHVNGPEIFGEWKKDLGYFEDLPEAERLDLIARATEKWNTRS